MKKLFAYDGPLVNFLTKTGEMLLLNIITLLCCVPIVTIGPALTSYYYATVKSVIHERGTPVKEYFKSFKRVLGKGILSTVIFIIWFFALWYGREMAINGSGFEMTGFQIALGIYNVLIGVSAAVVIYFFPVLSRYENKWLKLLKLSFTMCIRYFYFSILFLAVAIGFVWLIVANIMPILWVLVIPPALVYFGSFLMEKPLLKYMPPLPEDADDWYHEKPWKRDKNEDED